MSKLDSCIALKPVDRLESLSIEREYSNLHSIRQSITSNVGASQDKPSAGVNVGSYNETMGVAARTVSVYCCFRDFGSKA